MFFNTQPQRRGSANRRSSKSTCSSADGASHGLDPGAALAECPPAHRLPLRRLAPDHCVASATGPGLLAGYFGADRALSRGRPLAPGSGTSGREPSSRKASVRTSSMRALKASARHGSIRPDAALSRWVKSSATFPVWWMRQRDPRQGTSRVAVGATFGGSNVRARRA